MASKTLLLCGLFALLVVSEVVAASGKQSDTVKSASEERVQPDQYGGGHGGHGGYNGGGHGRYNGGGRGGYCRHGCCYRGYRGCARCCSYAGEAVQARPGH